MKDDHEYAKAILSIIPPVMRFIRTEMRIAAKSELTVPQFRILAKLSISKATNSDLAEWMGVSAPTMTRMVDPLVQRQFVTRETGSEDRRQINLELTASGQALFNKVFKRVHLKFT